MLLQDCPTSCVVMVSTSQDSEWSRKVLDAGGRHFFGKPIVSHQLNKSIYGAYDFSQKLKELYKDKS